MITRKLLKVVLPALAALALAALGCGLPSGPSEPAALFQDDFSSQDGAWDVLNTDPEILLQYDNGAYLMTVLAEDIVFSSVAHADLPADVSLEVDLSQEAGTLNTAMGLICRNTYSDEGNSLYFFLIAKDGTAKIVKYVYDQKTQLAGDNTVLPAIHAGSAVNRLRADCVGEQLTMYVNGTQVLSVADGSLTSGDHGLMVGTGDPETAVVRFDNFVVRSP